MCVRSVCQPTDVSNRWKTERGLPGTRLPTPQRGKALDGRGAAPCMGTRRHTHTCALNAAEYAHTHKRRHTHAIAFPLLWQLLCQSGELIMGKQICLGSPGRAQHIDAHRHVTHTQTHVPPPWLPSFLFQRQGPRSLEQPPGYQAQPRAGGPEGRRSGGGSHLGSPPCCPEAPLFSPTAPP